MPSRYFENFQLVGYANNVAVNVTERAALLNTVMNNPFFFYPYEIKEGERPDQIADRYYGDQYKSWMLYLANGITDPYYQWYLTNDQFNSFLKSKYNIEIFHLQEKTKFYRNNWYQDERTISVVDYEAMANTLHKFWQPEYGARSAIIGYQRVKDDTVINTNEVVSYSADGSNFIENEIVNVVFDIDNYGQGQVVIANSTNITIQHVTGVVTAIEPVVITGSSYIAGLESNANVAFTTATSVVRNIPLDEVIYYTPVSIYDYEQEMNESKRTIRVLGAEYSSQVATEIKALLK